MFTHNPTPSSIWFGERWSQMPTSSLARSDIVKAICLGARAVLCGRAYAYGLAAAGEAGVARALEILKGDVERTLRLLGCSAIAELDSSYVDTRLLQNCLR